jgi:hypothetical protein
MLYFRFPVHADHALQLAQASCCSWSRPRAAPEGQQAGGRAVRAVRSARAVRGVAAHGATRLGAGAATVLRRPGRGAARRHVRCRGRPRRGGRRRRQPGGGVQAGHGHERRWRHSPGGCVAGHTRQQAWRNEEREASIPAVDPPSPCRSRLACAGSERPGSSKSRALGISHTPSFFLSFLRGQRARAGRARRTSARGVGCQR